MARVFFINSKGKHILVLDLSSMTDVKESVRIIDECEEMIMRLPMKSVCLLTDVTDSSYDMIGIERLKNFSKSITPFMLASAVVGAKEEKKMIVDILEKISGRSIENFASRNDAVKYLSSF